MNDPSDDLRLCTNCGDYETTNPSGICWHCREQDMIDAAEPPGPIDWSAWDAEYNPASLDEPNTDEASN